MTKEQLILDGEALGIKLKKSMSIETMKAKIDSAKLDKVMTEAPEAPMAFDIDFSQMDAMTETVEASVSRVVEDGIEVRPSGEIISEASLETYCKDHSLEFSIVKTIIDRPWVQHSGYSFVRV